jgi:uncharacterized protein with NRDE domain
VCLLVAVLRPGADVPLLVGANRDERYDRPAVSCTVLAERTPRILGGRDLRAGGTWLAVNEHGVVAGLTNAPVPGGRDDTKRSRGELPLLAAAEGDAAAAAARLAAQVDPSLYNPAWMLVGDRTSLYALTIQGERVGVDVLGPGVHVLENRPPGYPSAKVDHVRGLLGPVDGVATPELARRLQVVLGDQTVPAGLDAEEAFGGRVRPPELSAACVHTDGYGTRSSALVSVRADPVVAPRIAVADGPPCTTPFVDRSVLWEEDPDPVG